MLIVSSLFCLVWCCAASVIDDAFGARGALGRLRLLLGRCDARNVWADGVWLARTVEDGSNAIADAALCVFHESTSNV